MERDFTQESRMEYDFIQRQICRLQRLIEDRDIESAHSEADAILCEILISYGLDKVVKAWKSVPKWYA